MSTIPKSRLTELLVIITQKHLRVVLMRLVSEILPARSQNALLEDVFAKGKIAELQIVRINNYCYGEHAMVDCGKSSSDSRECDTPTPTHNTNLERRHLY